MQIAKGEQKDIILVVDDLKEDWWLIQSERTIGPRPELVEEFSRITGQQFWMYTSDNFLRAAKTMTAADFADNIIQEVTERLASQREMLRPSDLKVTSTKPTPSDEARSALSKLLIQWHQQNKSQAKSTEPVEEPQKSEKVESDELKKEENDGRESEV